MTKNGDQCVHHIHLRMHLHTGLDVSEVLRAAHLLTRFVGVGQSLEQPIWG